VTRTFWLASYPKSGNTWLRLLIEGLRLKPGERLDINRLERRDGIASARAPFDHFSLIDSGLLTHEEIDRLRPRIHEAQSAAEDDNVGADEAVAGVRFVKVHDAYTLTPAGEPLLGGARAAAGAILITRDPRDVAPSLANHNGSTLDAAITLMNAPDGSFCGGARRQYPQLRQRLLSWSGFAESWLEQRDIPVHLLRYEDMKADAAAALSGVLAFADLEFSQEAIRRAVAAAHFDELRSQEQENGFAEWLGGGRRGGAFFRRGVSGAWRDELTRDEVRRIEAEHAAMMRRLGYDLAGL
jgi:aryl sulfotransferase